jgi:Tfp pilus assembly protein PilF
MRGWLGDTLQGTALSCLICVPGLIATAAPAWAQVSQAVGIRILVVRSEDEAHAALASVRAGVPFGTVVRQRSIGPNRERGGYLGRVDPADLAPEVRAAALGVPRGGFSPIFRTDEGFAVIQVLTEPEEAALELQSHNREEALKLLERGTALGQQGDLAEAAKALRRAVELDADLTDAHYNLAIAYRKLGQEDAAIQELQRVIQLDPRDFEAHMGLGRWLGEQGRHLEASQQYEQAALLRLNSTEAWRKLAESDEAAGKARAAAGAYRRVLDLLGRDDPAVLESLLRVALQAQDGPAAVEAARKLRAHHPGHEGFLMLGKALLVNGEAEAAAHELEKAAALAPSSAVAQAELGSAYAKLGKSEAATEHFLRAIQLVPTDPRLYLKLSQVYASSGRLDLAIVALRDGVTAAAASPRPLQASLVEELAALYDRAGMAREAARERQHLQSLRTP